MDKTKDYTKKFIERINHIRNGSQDNINNKSIEHTQSNKSKRKCMKLKKDKYKQSDPNGNIYLKAKMLQDLLLGINE